MDRRDLLKRFGIGAIIAPVIGGAVDRSASAELIEVPKVRPVELFSKMPEPLDLSKIVGTQVVFEMEDGTTRSLAISRHPWGSGKIGITDRLIVSMEFARVSDSSPRNETRIGRVSYEAALA